MLNANRNWPMFFCFCSRTRAHNTNYVKHLWQVFTNYVKYLVTRYFEVLS